MRNPVVFIGFIILFWVKCNSFGEKQIPYNSSMQLSNEAGLPLESVLDRAIQSRLRWQASFFSDPNHEGAFRLLNGFLEGFPDLVVDIYSRSLVLSIHGQDSQRAQALASQAAAHLLPRLSWLNTVIAKIRNAPTEQERRGVLLHGIAPDRKIKENGVWYSVDLMLNLDASLYLDTRNLRQWAVTYLEGKKVLNTFAYTGSLGVAALAAGARQVDQLDLNRRFLDLAQASCQLNRLPAQNQRLIAGDFWSLISRIKREGELYDCIFVDPPFFSQTERGRVDLVSQAQRVINKVRPLVGHGGALVTINNALFLSGADYLRQLEALCADGYLSIEELIPAPEDFTGFPETRVGNPPVDPAPFNHSTKIAVLRVRRKDGRKAEESSPGTQGITHRKPNNQKPEM